MAKIVQRSAQIVAAASFLFGGAAMLLEATPHNVWLLRAGWASVAFGAALFLFTLPIRGEYWWRRVLNRLLHGSLPPVVYLRNSPPRSPHFPEKCFAMHWRENELDLQFRGEGQPGVLPPGPVVEITMTFELFNAGDDPVRDVRVRWRLPNVDMAEMVKVLGASVRSFENGLLKLSTATGGSIHPLATDVASNDIIPVVGSRETVSIEAPRAFTEAYSICALSLAKAHHEKEFAQPLDASDPLVILEKWGTQMLPAFVELSYVTSSRRCKHAFSVSGIVWGGGRPVIHQPKDDAPMLHEFVPGVSARVDNVTVRPHER